MTSHDIGLFKLRSIPDNHYNSFFYLNKTDIPTNAILTGLDIVTLKINYGKNFKSTFFSSLRIFTSQTDPGIIGASPIMIQHLGLAENDDVFVSLTKSTPVTVVSVRPKSLHDDNILASIHNIIANVMLNQVRIVSPKQQITLKHGNIRIDLIVVNMKPSVECGRLEQYTEVEVLEKSDSLESDKENQLGYFSSYLTITDYAWRGYAWGIDFINNRLLSNKSIEEATVKSSSSIDFINNRLLSNKSIEEATVKSSSSIDLLMSAFKQKRSKVNYYRIVLDNNKSSDNNILYTNYGFQADYPTSCKITKVTEITVSSGSATKPPQTSFECFIQRKDNDLSPDGLEIYLTTSLMKQFNLNIGSKVMIEEIPVIKEPKLSVHDNNQSSVTQEKMFTWKSLASNLLQVDASITAWLKYGMGSNILIVGPSGCGKSSFLKKISNTSELKNVYSCLVDCKSLRGKKIEHLSKTFLSKFSECAYRDPSILLLDDLDSLMYLNEEEGENGMTNAYCKRAAYLLTGLLKSFQKTSKILLVATSSSVLNLGSSLATSRGPRSFSLVLSISELTSEERLEILKFLDVDKSTDFVNETNGFRIQDLHDLMSRAKMRSIMDSRDIITEDDLKAALKETIPMSLRGVELQTDVPYNWNDVGGMEDVKSVLNEIFRWPSTHPEIFSSCPLKMQTGALLYGPPGCGKTLIAGALANECGMNFKCVKGPELLSKYVGASEAAVRDLFENAQQARPCLVFFDELDSLAPRRGSDSTGVTDRVVNQLLTELDGVEGRSGVWILGASSRPDLIDPALLRPGRLDRAVYCPVPSKEERLRILEVLSKSLTLAEDVVFNNIIEKTEGFTGADLQALLYNTQMKTIQENPEYVNDVKIVLTAKHLDDTLLESKSSLSEIERRKYEQISKRFQGVKDFQKSLMSKEPQRVTFA